MDLIVVGLNHRTAPVGVRERIAFSEEEVRSVLGRTRTEDTLTEAILLSTCNRTELYGLSSDNGAAELYIRRLLEESKKIDLSQHPGYAYTLTRLESVRHLLRVAAGLDSLVLGEAQILGQVRRAYDLSCEVGACGIVLSRVLQGAVNVGRRVRNETRIGAGAVSVASAASELAGKIFEDLSSRSVLLIGVGEMGALTARHMIERGARKLVIANRTFRRAEELANELNGTPLPLDRLESALASADIVISSTGATTPIVTRAMMKPILYQRGGKPIYIIDIAVPRDFEGSIGDLDGIFLHDIDDMNVLVDSNLQKRRSEIPKAETIVEQELESFRSWRSSLAATPVIKRLRERVEELRAQELARHAKRFCTHDREQAELLTESLVNKILHPLMGQVRAWSEGDALGALRIDTLYEAFELDRSDERKKS
ncbi:MAG TPA: glutamyl-tRNA reductase [Vicinamibacteria bacterium]|nr:glutamyl-tRNA reductase [Vicinamibacteria bacterium]